MSWQAETRAAVQAPFTRDKSATARGLRGVALSSGTIWRSVSGDPDQTSTTHLARRDLSRPHAQFIDVPLADDHLDRGCRFRPGEALPLKFSQALKLKLAYCISIVSHDPSPLVMHVANFCSKHGGRWAAQKETQANYALGGCLKIRLLRCRSARPDRPATTDLSGLSQCGNHVLRRKLTNLIATAKSLTKLQPPYADAAMT